LGQKVTQKSEHDEALAQARLYQSRLESILDNIVDGLITIDERGFVQSYNKACERMFGYDAAEVIGQNIKMLMPTPYAENHDQYLQNYRETGRRKIIGIGRQVEAKKKDGTVFPIDLSVAEVKIGQQRLFSGIIRDLTERRLQDQQLRHGQKMEAVGQLTSGVAHDFNNLLTVILGNTRLIRKVMAAQKKLAVFADITERIDDIDVAAQRGADLVRRLMVFTRQRPLQKAELDINAAILEAQGLLMRALGETIHLRMALHDNIGAVQIDQDQFVNALINIVVNARDAMPQGGVLTIETKIVQLEKKNINQYPGLLPGPHIVISISDTGVGMPEEVRSRIFEPFYTTKAAGEGTGLGLSMVYGFVQQSEGYIDVQSEMNKGTTFKIYLPQIKELAS
jgi:PAS domain S-box-containing protein